MARMAILTLARIVFNEEYVDRDSGGRLCVYQRMRRRADCGVER